MKIAIFGGYFDPIHKAHVEIVKKLFEELQIDKVIIIPTNVSYYKKNKALLSYDQRLDICKIAINNDKYLCDKNIEISDIERDIKNDEGYAHTLIKIKNIYPNDDIYTVIGSDSYNYIDTWRSYEKILELSKLIVITRPENEIRKDLNIPYIKLDMNEDISSTKIRNEIIEFILSKLEQNE